MVHVFVPRWMDLANTNAQNLNAKALLSRFSDPRARWTAVCGETPSDLITKNGIATVRLSRTRWWEYRLALAYQSRFDAIFYPGPHWGDEVGVRVRSLSGRARPVVMTLEGIIASADAVQQLSGLFGHRVVAEPFSEQALARLRRMYGMADHIIAISPFLQKVARFLYGDKVSFLPLGVESAIFHNRDRQEPGRCRVVGCGTVKTRKRPELFLRLGERYKEADFVWFGDGPMRQDLISEAKRRNLTNVDYAGPVQPEMLAHEFRRSSLFVLPSDAEGVPKVTQEACTCGLPIVIKGFYESTTALHMQNGLVAWSDDELVEHVGILIHDSKTRTQMGEKSAKMAESWDWNRIAPQWEKLVLRLVS